MIRPSSTVVLALLCAMAAPVYADPVPALLSSAGKIQDWLVSIRRELHQTPELMFELHNTSATVMRNLERLDIPYKFPYAETGIVATIGHGTPIVALRADMDALPLQEPDGLLYKSKLLKSLEANLKGTVKLIFQPAEEGGAGGDIMIKEGALDGVSAAFALHVWPAMASGIVGTRGGTIMAGALSFRITVLGRGGHAAIPHLNIDPIVASAHVITALQTLVSRETSPFGSAVLSITMLRAGDAYNIIPDTAMMGGTIRGLSHDDMLRLQRRVEEVAPTVASAFGCTAEVDWRLGEQPYYPPTVNHDQEAAFFKQTAARLLGDASRVTECEPSMGAEDFAFFGMKIPSVYAFLGIRNETVGSVANLHSPNFKLDESVLSTGAALQAAAAIDFLERNSDSAAKEEL